jgi:ABC-2 type transport system permease protein
VKRHRVRAIIGNELRQVARGRDYLLPLGLLASLFFVVIPVVMLSMITRIGENETAQAAAVILDTLPETARQNIEGDRPESRAGYAIAVYLLAPIAIVVPLTVATAVGAAAIVGERERGTGEFLAHSPATEQEIYVGKLVAALIPGYLATIGGFAVYSVIVNLIVGPSMGRWFFPTTDWLLLIFWVVPPFIAVALSVIVMISARAKTTAGAQQASQLVSLPVIIIAYFVATGLLFNAVVAALVIGAIAWAVALIGLARGARAVSREKLIGVDS